MPSVIVHIAPTGNPVATSGRSVTGCTWFPFVNDFGNHPSFGFAPVASVQAMAASSPPASDQTPLPPAYQSALAPVIEANWQ